MAGRASRASKRVLEAPTTPKQKLRKVQLPPTPETPTSGLSRTPSVPIHAPLPPTLSLDVHPPAYDPPIELVHAPLSFKLADARAHLESVDPRFKPFFERMSCTPYEEVESDPEAGLVNPFRSLCSSILGQQISWLAARAIRHKFLRIYHPELPEKLDPAAKAPAWPSPKAVAETSMDDLRKAGLSQRKGEYIQDLASRFADGRLDPLKLVKMSDEEVLEALTAVRGIGVWTVHMFMMFTLRRPDVLPVGDLGIQKGLVRWYTSVTPSIADRKLEMQGKTKDETHLPTPPGSPREESKTPDDEVPPLPDSETLTPAVLRSRLTKKIKGNIYLNARECEELTKAWQPYRYVVSFRYVRRRSEPAHECRMLLAVESDGRSKCRSVKLALRHICGIQFHNCYMI